MAVYKLGLPATTVSWRGNAATFRHSVVLYPSTTPPVRWNVLMYFARRDEGSAVLVHPSIINRHSSPCDMSTVRKFKQYRLDARWSSGFSDGTVSYSILAGHSLLSYLPPERQNNDLTTPTDSLVPPPRYATSECAYSGWSRCWF